MSPSPPTAGRVGVGSPPPSARAGPLPASGCQQGRGGAGGRLRVFKGSLRRLLSSKLTTFSSWTPVTMWFLILFLALALGGTGETWGKGSGRGQSPDSHVAFSPENPFPFLLTPAAPQITSAPSLLLHNAKSLTVLIPISGPCSLPFSRTFSSSLAI